MKYGNCLQVLYSCKRKFSEPLHRLLKKQVEQYLTKDSDFREIVNLNPVSWEFYSQFFGKIMPLLGQYINMGDSSSQEFYNFLADELGKDFEEQTNNSEISFVNAVFAHSLALKAVRHYYVENTGLSTFLRSVEIKNLKDVADFLLENADEKVFDRKGNTIVTHTFCVHLPEENNGIAYCLKYDTGKEKFVCYTIKGKEYKSYPLDEKRTKRNLLDEINTNDDLKLCFNLIGYTNCFKDYLRDGVPDDSNEKPTSAPTMSLRIADEIRNEIEKISHFRHGHFRYLQSEKFKAKRNTWIYVKPSMVNAKAETVEGKGDL